MQYFLGDKIKFNPYNDAWQIFVHNVKWLRQHFEFSQESMAEMLNISTEKLKEVEKGEMPEELTSEVFVRIHNFFGIEAKDIISHMLSD